jgi:hypothetical protein
MLENLNGTHIQRQYGDVINLILSLNEGKWSKVEEKSDIILLRMFIYGSTAHC